MPTALSPIAGTESITVDNTAGGKSLAVPTGARHAILTLTDGSGTCRFTDDGTTVTTSVGHQLQPGDALNFTNPDRDYREVLLALRFIREDSTNGTLIASYYA